MKVALVNMPFAVPERPSIALGILHSLLKEEAISVATYYLNLEFCKEINPTLVTRIITGESQPFELVGEWVFSQLLDGSIETSFVADILREPRDKNLKETDFAEAALLARDCVDGFIQKYADELVDAGFRVICFILPRLRWPKFGSKNTVHFILMRPPSVLLTWHPIPHTKWSILN
jgi:hypothetical protein